MLNVGPTADGRIPVIQQQRLKDIGDWLNVNGEAIYESEVWEGANETQLDDVFFTKKDDAIYVICTSFPENPVQIKGIKSAKVSMLGFSGSISVQGSKNGVTIAPPAITPANNPLQLCVGFQA